MCLGPSAQRITSPSAFHTSIRCRNGLLTHRYCEIFLLTSVVIVYCTCGLILSQELDALGLSTCIEASSPRGAGLNSVPALNAMYELMQIHRRHMSSLEELEREQLKKSSTLDHIQMNNSRLKVCLSGLCLSWSYSNTTQYFFGLSGCGSVCP